MSTIEFKASFKEKIKNLFLYNSKFVNTSILIFEHFNRPEFKEYLPQLEEIYDSLFPKFLEDINDSFNTFYFDFFYKAENIENMPSISIMKTPYNVEKKQLEKQFSELEDLEYTDSLKNNKIFESKLKDFLRIVTPDNEFSEEVERKELWMLSKDNKSEETTESLVIGNDPTGVHISQDEGFEVGDDGFGYSGSNKTVGMVIIIIFLT